MGLEISGKTVKNNASGSSGPGHPMLGELRGERVKPSLQRAAVYFEEPTDHISLLSN